MMKKISEKYNEACIKVFDMLKLLSKGTAGYYRNNRTF